MISKVLLASTIAACSRMSTAPGTLLSVGVTPAFVNAKPDQVIGLAVTVRNTEGGIIQPDSVRWRSSDTLAVSVSAGGAIQTLRAVDQARVTATAYWGIAKGSGQSVVTVTQF